MTHRFFILQTLLMLFLPAVQAAPPYLGIDTIQNLHFSATECVTVADTMLQQDGFAKRKIYPSKGTLFAAYRHGHNYGFKAVIKCLPETGTLIVVVTAETTKFVKTKATELASAISDRFKIPKISQTISNSDHLRQCTHCFGRSVGELNEMISHLQKLVVQKTREHALQRLTQLLPAQFETVVFRYKMPRQFFRGKSQAECAIELIEYAQQGQYNGLERLLAIINEVAPSPKARGYENR